jgi:hypothetical protein
LLGQIELRILCGSCSLKTEYEKKEKRGQRILADQSSTDQKEIGSLAFLLNRHCNFCYIICSGTRQIIRKDASDMPD